MAPRNNKKNDARPPPTPPPATPPHPASLDDQEAALLLQLKAVQDAKASRTQGPPCEHPRRAADSAAPIGSSVNLTPCSAEIPTVHAPLPTAVAFSTAASQSVHHASTAPAKTIKKISKPKREKNKKLDLSNFLEKAVNMDKNTYNYFLRVVRDACTIGDRKETWKTISHTKKALIIRSVVEDDDIKEYLLHRFINDWPIEMAAMRHLQDRKRASKRAVRRLRKPRSNTATTSQDNRTARSSVSSIEGGGSASERRPSRSVSPSNTLDLDQELPQASSSTAVLLQTSNLIDPALTFNAPAVPPAPEGLSQDRILHKVNGVNSQHIGKSGKGKGKRKESQVDAEENDVLDGTPLHPPKKSRPPPKPKSAVAPVRASSRIAKTKK